MSSKYKIIEKIILQEVEVVTKQPIGLEPENFK